MFAVLQLKKLHGDFTNMTAEATAKDIRIQNLEAEAGQVEQLKEQCKSFEDAINGMKAETHCLSLPFCCRSCQRLMPFLVYVTRCVLTLQ